MPKAIFVCDSCGGETAKWAGKCPFCGQWDSLKEIERVIGKKPRKGSVKKAYSPPQKIKDVESDGKNRTKTGISEFDRVLGGGFVRGSLVLVSGEPGIGKSTLLLQVANKIPGKVIYVSGEENAGQIKIRAQRTGIDSENILLFSETNLESILDLIDKEKPEAVIIDSVQIMYSEAFDGAAGSIGQVKEITNQLLETAKAGETTIFLIGHITKAGAIAGPKTLEHMVDTVLYLEGQRYHAYRILRTQKNRFGPTSELGVFEMTDSGMKEIPNPSEVFLKERAGDLPGSVTTVTIEGSKPFLIEVQALTSTTVFGYPKRTASGVDLNRMQIMTAVLSKRVGIKLANQDVYLNIVGGILAKEPACDLAVCLAIASSIKGEPVDQDTVAFGEVGLSGELRNVTFITERILEAHKLGFGKCILPRNAEIPEKFESKIKILRAKDVREAINFALK